MNRLKRIISRVHSVEFVNLNLTPWQKLKYRLRDNEKMTRALGIVNNLTHVLFETTPIVRSSLAALKPYYAKSLQWLHKTVSFYSRINYGSVSSKELHKIRMDDEIRRQHGYDGINDDKPYT